MEDVIYSRIKELCVKNNITISRLEAELGFANASIKKWGRSSSPSVDKIKKVAEYFDVTTDYLLGMTDIKSSFNQIMEDNDIIAFQRAKEKMPSADRERMMKMLKVAFNEAFEEDDSNK